MSNLDGFEGTLQKEYNSSCVGPYMGPYDQHKSLHLNCQLAASDLDYNQYTSFIHHEEFHCKTFSVKDSYEGLPALEQIDGLQVEGGAESIDQDANENGGEEEDEDAYRVFYTCQKKGCKIPCPCRPCCLEEEQCDEHRIVHAENFEVKSHMVAIRSVEEFCVESSFFNQCYLVKFPGIPVNQLYFFLVLHLVQLQ
jgi:hypothetical protein